MNAREPENACTDSNRTPRNQQQLLPKSLNETAFRMELHANVRIGARIVFFWCRRSCCDSLFLPNEARNGIGTAFGTVFEYFVGKWETIGVCSFSQRGVFGCSVRAEKESKEKSECRYMNRFLRYRTRTYIHICREISTTSTVFKSHTNLVINVECEKPNAWQFLRFQVSPSPP